jgi:L-ascorbate metabolism protein UlaG (beta-lactamase superfamily)
MLYNAYMKTLSILVVAILIIAAAFFVFKNYVNNQNQENATSTPETSAPISPVQVTPISHATAVLQWDTRVIYTDPTDASLLVNAPKPNIILVTDIHPDHFSTTTLAMLMATGTDLIVPQAVKDLLPAPIAARATVLKNGETITSQGFSITGIPMYNLPEATSSPHIKGRGNGYVVAKNGFRLYVAGDTSGTPEMRALTAIDLAFIPMNLPYTMSVEEAADAVLAFNPKQVYPYHYRGANGLADIAKFKQLVNAGNPTIDVVLANWYPGQ